MKRTQIGRIEGILKRHPDGFGFVIPEDKKHPDIYIPSAKMGSALTNDRVEVVVYQKRKGGDRSYFGFIKNILKRDKEFVVGVCEVSKNQFYLFDHNLAFSESIPLSNPKKISVKKGDFVKAKIQFQKLKALRKKARFIDRDSVLDPSDLSFSLSARDSRGDSVGKNGARMQNFSNRMGIKAELSENLGPISSSAKDDVKRVMAEYDIPFDFSHSVLKEVKQLPSNVREKDYSDRTDLRQKAFVTIDGATAQDFDDAVFVERHKSFYRLYVAIADVSYYVREGSELDQSAFERGNSSYFPNFCSPMLPEKLSHDLCSLKERENRLVMVQEMDFDFKGDMRQSKLYPSVIKSRKRLTYGQVQEILDQFSEDGEPSQSQQSYFSSLAGDSHFEKDGSQRENFNLASINSPEQRDYLRSLKQAQALAQILIQKHIKEWGFDLEIPETLIVVDQQGEPQDILKERRLFSHKMIEQFMLSANKAVSAFLEKKQSPLMYRIHESPDLEKLKVLQEFSKTIGYSKGFKSRKNLIQFLSRYKNHERSSLIHKLILRSLPQARYSVLNKGHYGLNFQSYTHFTSPIRRYCDLQIHRLIKQTLAGGDSQNKTTLSESSRKDSHLPENDEVKNLLFPQKRESLKQRSRPDHNLQEIKTCLSKELENQASFISAREQNSVKAERKIKDIKSARFFKKYVGENLEGSISSITRFGLFILIKTFFVEGLVRFQKMRGFWEVDEFQLNARNKKSGYLIQLGDKVEVLVTASHVQTGQVDLQLLSHKGKAIFSEISSRP